MVIMMKLINIYNKLKESLQDDNLDKAVKDVWKLGTPHPFMKGSIWFDKYEATLDISKFDGMLWIGSLIINEDQRGKGYASDILKSILDIADKYQVQVGLSAEPFGRLKTLSKSKLTAWYKRHGFKSSNGRLVYTPKNNIY